MAISYKAVVTKGIRLLDRKGPKRWRQKINLRTLDMGHGTQCILGQIYGSYPYGLAMIFGKGFTHAKAVAHGFNVPVPRGPRRGQSIISIMTRRANRLKCEWIKQIGDIAL